MTPAPSLAGVERHSITVRGVRLHVAEAGTGPLVVLLHGFPESWWSWRHQLVALSNAGYRVVAPDQRGYGDSDAPDIIDAYDQVELSADVAALIEALGESRAVVVGHDWGAPVAWHTALLHPDRVRAVVGLSIPYGGRPKVSPLQRMRETFTDAFFYMLYFQTPGVAEAEMEADVRRSLRHMLYTWSGDAPAGLAFAPKPASARLLDGMQEFDAFPAWLEPSDLDVYVAQFERSGFRGPLNWYRNFDRSHARTTQLDGAKVTQPALFVAGASDPALLMSAKGVARMSEYVPRLAKSAVLQGAGHWIQQERPGEVNTLLIEFLNGL